MNPGNVNMANLGNMPNIGNMGGPVGAAGPMPMMNNVAGAQQVGNRPQQTSMSAEQRTLLNTYIYEYFLRFGMIDCARTLLQTANSSDNSVNVHDVPKNSNGDAMDTDNKDDLENKNVEDLPPPRLPASGSEGTFLFEWFNLFWDIYQSQHRRPNNPTVHQYVNHVQATSRMKQNQQQEYLRAMQPNNVAAQQFQMMRMQNGGMAMAGKGLVRTAVANNQNNPQAMQMLQQAKQNQMQRDPSNIDANRGRASSPGSNDNAPSPSKRPRLGEGNFNPNQQGGRPGMPGQQMPSAQAAQMLQSHGIDPNTLSAQQLNQFASASPAAQQKSLNTYSSNLGGQQNQQMKQMPSVGMQQGQGSPMMPNPGDPNHLNAFYNADGAAMRAQPGAGQAGTSSNHALQDYQMQLMLLEQQNKKRLMMARQEQDNMGGVPRPDGPVGQAGPGGPGAQAIPTPGGPGGPVAAGGQPGPNGPMMPEQSPQAASARTGASPNPSEQMKRGAQPMNNGGVGSPMPDGQASRGSPNPMTFMGNEMQPGLGPHFMNNGNMVANGQMNGMRPPSSHPGQPGQQQPGQGGPQFNGQVNPQMMAGRQQGAAGQMAQQGPQGQQVPQGNAPQRGSMPPPSGPTAAASNANSRTTASPQATPQSTPSVSNKAGPKKKDSKAAKNKKKSNTNLNAAATPASEPNPDAEPPTPATPMTPGNAPFKAGQASAPGGPVPNGQQPGPAAPTGGAAPTAPPAAAPAVAQPPHPDAGQNSTFGIDNSGGMVDFSSLDFTNNMNGENVLNDFDFDSFLHDDNDPNSAFDFSNGFTGMEGNEIGAE